MARFGQIKDPRVDDRVALSYSGDMIPSIVREINKDKTKVRLEVIGNKFHRPWLGLHWVSVHDIHEIVDEEFLGLK